MPVIDSQQAFALRRATPSARDERFEAFGFLLVSGLVIGALAVALPILIVIAMH